MSEVSHGTERGPTQRNVELGVTVATFVFGIIVILGAFNVGISWGIEGPQAGFIPFYVGLFILGASAINFFKAFGGIRRDKLFAQWGELRSVVSVAIPIVIYVGLVPFLGVYVSSIFMIGIFMKWLGRFGWLLTAAIAVGVPVFTFIVFERWFLIPLPKGPVEDFFNL